MNVDTTPPGEVELDSLAFRDVIGRFASGVTVITASEEDRLHGATASAVSSLSDTPPMILICLNRSSSTGAAVARTGRFAVNVLAEDHAEVAMRFAGRLEDKFADTPHALHDGLPLLSGAIAHLVCEVFEQTTGGTHYVFLARVTHAVAFPGHPLAYFRGTFGRMQTQPEASVVSALREWIVANGSERDEPIVVSDLAEAIGVEEGLAHRALTALVGEGVVTRRDGRFVIAPLPEEMINDAYRAKSVIEAGVATRIAGRLSEADLNQMRDLAVQARAIAQRGDFSEAAEWIAAFHRFNDYVVGLAGSHALVEAYRALNLPGVDRRSLDEKVYARIGRGTSTFDVVDAYATGDLRRVLDAIKSPNRQPSTIRALAAADPE